MSKPLSVEVVSTSRHERDFFSLRRKIYRLDANVVFPLKSMERKQLSPTDHPFFEHATREMFVCYRGQTPVGRIVAIKDQMHNDQHGDQVGFFGCFEAEDDQTVVDALISSASAWLVANGCDTMRGSVNPSMKSDFGVVVEGNDDPPCIMMGYSLKRYDAQLLNNGFEIARTFHAFKFVTEDVEAYKPQWVRIEKVQARILKRYPQLSFRSTGRDNFEKTLRDINVLGNTVRSEGWGFVPLTENELMFMIKNLRRVIRFELIHTAYWDDQLVGYIVSIPDVNWALKRTRGQWDWLRMLQLPGLIKSARRARVIALGVDENYRKKGIAMLLIQKIIEQHRAFDEWEFSWVDSENIKSMRAIAGAVPLIRNKTYRLYDKPIG